jgi:hypothetical protein
MTEAGGNPRVPPSSRTNRTRRTLSWGGEDPPRAPPTLPPNDSTYLLADRSHPLSRIDSGILPTDLTMMNELNQNNIFRGGGGGGGGGNKSSSLISRHRRGSTRENMNLLFRTTSTFGSGNDIDNDTPPRLVKRNLPNFQSVNTLDIANRNLEWNLTYRYDFFHAILRWTTWISVASLISIWTVLILAFATVYQYIDQLRPLEDCGLGSKGDPIDFNGAFAFSLETCTTVGYGLPGGGDAFFSNCPGLQLTIYFQMVCSMLFNAFLFAFFFARLARAEQRGHQVLFSNKAIVEYRNGKWLFHARIYDLDASQPVVEAHVRMYALSWKMYEQQIELQPHLLHTMRLLQPDDELGSFLFTSVPATVSHHIDVYSPLAPAHLRDNHNVVQKNGLALREVDRMVENSGGIPCPICGETFGTFQNLERHIEYSKLLESNDNIPIEGSHQDSNRIKPAHTKQFEPSEEELKQCLEDKEIMCVLEGIEPLVSGTFQALQSYKLDDIVFHGRYAPCMSHRDGKISVDLERFHEIIPPAATPMTPKPSRTKKV